MSLTVLTQGGGTGGASASIFITGLSETDTVTATKGNKTVNGKWTRKTLLPRGYTQLECIKSTGTQYAITDYYPNPNTVVKMDLCIDSITYVDGWSQIFGVNVNGSNSDFAILGQSSNNFYFYHGGQNGHPTKFTIGKKYTIEFGKGAVILDGIHVGTFNVMTNTSALPVIIGAVNPQQDSKVPKAQ